MRLFARIAAVLQRVLPDRLFWRVHGVVVAFVTPMRFTYLTGHFRSSMIHRPMDKSGAPSPWMTYPVINFLEGKDYRDRRVLEWGSGESTLWWAKRAGQVVSFESDPSWFKQVSRRAPANVAMRLVKDDLDGVPADLREEKFDVIVVDGLDRLACARASVDLLTDDGAIIFDDSEQPWSPKGYPILDLLRERGLQRIDFFGHAPAVIRRHCTSVFFKERCFLFSGTEVPRQYDSGL